MLAQLPAREAAQAKSSCSRRSISSTRPCAGPRCRGPAPPTFFERIQDFGTNWSGFLGIIFMALLVFVLWRTLKVMPRTKPMQLKPEANLDVGWDDIAGVDEARRADRGRRVPARPQALPPARRAVCPRVCCCTARRGPARRCSPRRWRTSSARSSSRSRRPRSSRCSRASGGAHPAPLQRGAQGEPAVVFIDELDAVGAKRGSDNNSEREQTLNQLLVEMDGFSSSDQVVVIAASNLLEKLDSALLRPGRFDRQVFVSPPDVGGRARSSTSTPRQAALEDVDLGVIAQQTSGLTGADLANICNEAASAARAVAATRSRWPPQRAADRRLVGRGSASAPVRPLVCWAVTPRSTSSSSGLPQVDVDCLAPGRRRPAANT